MHFSPSLYHVQLRQDRVLLKLTHGQGQVLQLQQRHRYRTSLSKQAFPRYGIERAAFRAQLAILLKTESLGPLLSLGVSKSMWKFGPDANRPPPFEKENFVYQA